MTVGARPPRGVKCSLKPCDNYAGLYVLAGDGYEIAVCHQHRLAAPWPHRTSDVICSYYGCPERATKNLVATREVDGATDTWDIPYCDLHYEENK